VIFMNGDREEGDLNNSGYLLDTDILIAFLRGKNARLKRRMNELLRRDIPVYMSIISLGGEFLKEEFWTVPFPATRQAAKSRFHGW
jgi:hypothetical protein